MTRNEFTLLYAIRKGGMQSVRQLKDRTGLSVGYISQTLKQFAEEGLAGGEGLTEAGLQALEPYRVQNAVIMAAGMSSRFVPISLEKPKGLLTVKGEALDRPQRYFGTSLVVKTESDAEAFIRGAVEYGWEPHYAVAMGDISGAVKALGKMLGIEVFSF